MSQLQAARGDDREHLAEHAGVEMPGVRKPLVRRFAGSPEAVVHARAFARNRNSYRAALRRGNARGIASAGGAGWLFPVDPLLQPGFDCETWRETFAMLSDRAA